MAECRIISLGTLAAHPLRGERSPVRTGHATTSLVTSGRRKILVDPGLPAPAVVAHLGERTGLGPADITDVFLTRFCADTARGLRAFEHADWWTGETERETVGVGLVAQLQSALGDAARLEQEQDDDPFAADTPQGDDDLLPQARAAAEELRLQVAALHRTKAAPDQLADGVDLFPLPGVTPGLCGLLLPQPGRTILICGDAIPTIEHLAEGKVLPKCADTEQAQESFKEAVEIADALVLGRDNQVENKAKGLF